MPRARKPQLGRRLLRALERVTDLMEAVRSDDELRELDRERARLLKLIGQLVDESLDQASQEYEAATSALGTANLKIRRAIEDLEMVAEAIKKLGQALDLVAKLAPA
jgi:hypothetical protein